MKQIEWRGILQENNLGIGLFFVHNVVVRSQRKKLKQKNEEEISFFLRFPRIMLGLVLNCHSFSSSHMICKFYMLFFNTMHGFLFLPLSVYIHFMCFCYSIFLFSMNNKQEFIPKGKWNLDFY